MSRELQTAIEFLQTQQRLIEQSERNAQLAARTIAENQRLRRELANLQAQQIPIIDDGDFARIPKDELKKILNDYEFRMGSHIDHMYENRMTPAPSFSEYLPEMYELFMRIHNACL